MEQMKSDKEVARLLKRWAMPRSRRHVVQGHFRGVRQL